MREVMRQVWRWPLYSPLRLVVAIVGLVLALVLVSVVKRAASPEESTPDAKPPSQTQSATPTSPDEDESAAAPSPLPSEALDVARAFVAAWAAGGDTRAAWQQKMRPYATRAFLAKLGDPKAVDATKVSGNVRLTDTGGGDTTSAAVGTDAGVVSVSLVYSRSAEQWYVRDVQPGAQEEQ